MHVPTSLAHSVLLLEQQYSQIQMNVQPCLSPKALEKVKKDENANRNYITKNALRLCTTFYTGLR
jgi:hypothetical protein